MFWPFVVLYLFFLERGQKTGLDLFKFDDRGQEANQFRLFASVALVTVAD